MGMIPTILIVVFIIVVIYFFLSGKELKIKLFGKKEHKVKASKSNEEKYKDVIPKEKEKKEKKEKKTKFSNAVKKEKIKQEIKKEISETLDDAKKSEATGGATVTKITKEDFVKNNIQLPSSSSLVAEEKKPSVVLPKDKEQPSKPYDFGLGSGENDPFAGIGGDSDPFAGLSDGDDSDPFAGIDIDELLNSSDEEFDAFLEKRMGSTKTENRESSNPYGMDLGELKSKPQLDVPKFNQFSAKDYFNDDSESGVVVGNSKGFSGKTLGDRFEEVFGEKFREMGGTEQGKEIIVSDILGSPRSEINKAKRAEREKRKKWM